MDLRQKLARLRSPGSPNASLIVSAAVSAAVSAQGDHDLGVAGPRSDKLAALRALIGSVVSRSERRANATRPAEHVACSLPWPGVETPHGAVHVLERELDARHHHGHVCVASALGVSSQTLAWLCLDPALAELDLSRMLFLDTETTGLSGGTGTVAFLIGLASFRDGALVLEQLVLPNLGCEAPMLARLAERLAVASCVVSYNGKSFDWPLLRTRFLLARMPLPPLPPHIDLLHTARRVWKPRLGSVRLTEIEREILRFEREGDIDGAEIPGRYFEFLRGAGAERLAPVLEHNQHDVIALAAILGTLGQRFERGELELPPEDALAFARLAARADAGERAGAFAQAVIDGGFGDAHTRAAYELLCQVERRAGDPQAAARALEDALAFARTETERATLHFALAKLYEHELRDAQRAHLHALHTERIEGPAAHGKRLGRLRRRLFKQAQA
jgi:uncharacterized protein